MKYLIRQLVGYRVHSSTETGSKETRAEPLASQVNVGNVLMLKAPWNDALIAELRVFPNGTYDDQVDGLSRAFGLLIGRNPSEIFIPDANKVAANVAAEISALGTCGRCSAFDRETKLCGENFGMQVGENDVGCGMFIAK